MKYEYTCKECFGCIRRGVCDKFAMHNDAYICTDGFIPDTKALEEYNRIWDEENKSKKG